jgi:hypothetical protein
MKYVVTWTTQLNGSGKENEAAVWRGLELFSEWQPPHDIPPNGRPSRLNRYTV